MPEQVHGHEVMRMMIDDGRVHTKATLRAAIAERFGEGTKFYTCSAENMTADELVAFLESRSKFIHEGKGFRTELDRMCKD
jgi:probable metal-binding protein